jgi:hypothetical protein
MEKDQEHDFKNMLQDLIWLNGVIATELIQLVENSSAALRGSVPEKCLVQHNELRQQALQIVARNCGQDVSSLEKHIKGH